MFTGGADHARVQEVHKAHGHERGGRVRRLRSGAADLRAEARHRGGSHSPSTGHSFAPTERSFARKRPAETYRRRFNTFLFGSNVVQLYTRAVPAS